MKRFYWKLKSNHSWRDSEQIVLRNVKSIFTDFQKHKFKNEMLHSIFEMFRKLGFILNTEQK